MSILGSLTGVPFARNKDVPAAAPPTGYGTTVTGISGLISYWRLAEAGGLLLADSQGSRTATLSDTGVGYLFPALPAQSNSAIDFQAAAYAEVPHDAGLALSAFTLSFWFRLNRLPAAEEGRFALISKDLPGLADGDFTVWVEADGDVAAQFQSTSNQFLLSLSAGVVPDVNYHVAVRADSTGFELIVNAQQTTNLTSFTGAWTANTRVIRFGAVEWLVQSPDVGTPGVWPTDAILLDGALDEIALYNRRLNDAEVLSLSQYNTPPLAQPDAFVVPELATSVLNVTANDVFVGPKSNLIVSLVSQPANATATVRPDKDIDLVAGDVETQTADAFNYRISDAISQSNVASVNLTINPTPVGGGGGDDGLGGTLIYHFEPLASWIDGVPLSARDTNDIVGDGIVHWWQDGANPANGGDRIGHDRLITVDWSGVQNSRWNRAPTGHPSLEGVAATTLNAVWLWALLFWEAGVINPRHLRVVVELKHSVPSDPNTFRDGGGTYGDFASSFQGHHSGKYFGGMTAGPGLAGSCSTNWWQRLPGSGGPQNFVRDRGYMANAFGNNGDMRAYAYFYGRDAACGGPSTADPGGVNVIHSSMNGLWNRFEYEVKLQNPALVNSSWGGTSFPSGGDGFIKLFVTKDIDGTPSARIPFVNAVNQVLFGSDNNNHRNVNLRGNFMNQYHGGTAVPRNGYSVWMRKLQIYHYTEDDI